MSDFIREVDEEVRQDRFRLFLDRYWPALLAVVVLVLAGVGAWRANEYLASQSAQAAGGRYLDALDVARDGKPADAGAAFDAVAKDGTPGYRLLARFAAAAQVGRTDARAGSRLFDAIAQDSSVDPALQNLARLRANVLLVDVMPYADLKTSLEPLADANNSLRNSARELLAVAALKAGQNEEAGRWLDAIEIDASTTAAQRQRAEAMLGLVRAGGGEVTSPAPDAATQPSLPPAAASPSDKPPP